jgi:transcriptional regulator with GAF, ATPase, and Fis domain
VGPESWPYINLLFQAMELLCGTERGQENATFYKILSEVANKLGSNRTSLIIVDAETDSGVVLSSSDDPKFVDFPISLHKYPEILHVMHTGNFVCIEDTSQNQMTQKISETVRTIAIGSMMVFPVRFAGEVVGVMAVRRKQVTDLPSMDTMRVLQALANTLAAHSNIKALLRKIYKDYTAQAAEKNKEAAAKEPEKKAS